MTEPLESTPGMIDSQKSSGVRWRSVAVPKEHGGWGFLLDPILLGLLVAPSPAGLFLVLLDLAAFLARTPLKIVWKDTQRGRRYARTAAALKALFVYAVLAVFSLVAALILGGPQGSGQPYNRLRIPSAAGRSLGVGFSGSCGQHIIDI